MTSEWVPEAQRIAKEAAEKARGEVMKHVDVAMGLLIQNAPSAAQALLEALVLETDIPRPERLHALSMADWKRMDAKANEVALNDRLAEARDAALEEAAQVPERIACASCEHESCKEDRIVAERIRARKGRKS